MDVLMIAWTGLLLISWPLLLLFLALMVLVCGWHRRWRRAGLAFGVLAGLLIWSVLLPAIHRHRMAAAIERGGIIGTVPQTLAGAQVLVFGREGGRSDASACGGLLGAAGVARLWQADWDDHWVVPRQPAVAGGYDPVRCRFRPLGGASVPRPQWALLPEDRGFYRVADNPAFDALVAAHLGEYAARRVSLAYLLAPMDSGGRVLAEQAAVVGFKVEVDARPWWWTPLLPVTTTVSRPATDPGLDRLRDLTCGGDWPCAF